MRVIVVLLLLCSNGIFAASYEQSFESRKSWFEQRQLLENALKEGDKPKYVNSLIGADSPYLLSHALQPVNWLQWQSRFENDFASENKLIFISIGYETCHWCHVMAQESFNSEAVAAVLNQHFVNIKVDREQWPLVDNRYKLALEWLKGEAGWPINVILTPEGHILWADSYLPQAKLLKVLNALTHRWQTKPATIRHTAANISAQLNSLAEPAVINNINVNKVVDEVYLQAGYSLQNEAKQGGPRFIREYWLLGLLQKYFEHNDKSALALVTHHVDSLLMSPTYDGINGGFHRYAVDGAWLKPHFEKMLYTQAFMIKVLAQLYIATAEIKYRIAMEQTIDWVETALIQKGGRSSAMSAVSDGFEGGYYYFGTDVKADLDLAGFSLVGNQSSGLVALTDLNKDWTNNEAHRRLIIKRKQNVAPLVDEKVIVSWNAMYITALLEAYSATDNKQFLDFSIKAADELWQTAIVGQKLHRIVFQGRASIDATLEDFAWMAQVFTQLSFYEDWPTRVQSTHDSDASKLVSHRERAKWLLDQLVIKYQFSLVQALDRDGEVPSVYSSVYQAMALGYQSFSEKKYADIAKELINKHADSPKSIADNFSFWASVKGYQSNTVLSHRYFARGHGKVTTSNNESGVLIEVDLEPGWHVNANPSSNEKLIATNVEVLELPELFSVDYPKPILRHLGFSQTELALYQGKTNIIIKLADVANSVPISINKPINLKVTLQACSDSLCLLPEEFILISK
jgi:uncharacterized protein YyaL (SSP411 family)